MTHDSDLGFDGIMRTTKDTYTGKPFRWNACIGLRNGDGPALIRTPARFTSRTSTWLDPSRVGMSLLVKLNPGKDIPALLAAVSSDA